MKQPGLPPRWRTAAGFLALCAGAFALRAAFIFSSTDGPWPFSIFYFGDAAHFHAYAANLARGQLYDNGLPFHPPGFAWLLYGLYALGGVPTGSRVGLKLVLAAINALTVGLAWLWWRRLMGRAWAVLGAVVLASHFGWLVFSATFNNEVLYALWLTLTLGLTWRWRARLPWAGAAALGGLMAAGALTRGEHLALWPFLALYAWRERDRGVPLRTHALRWGAAAALSVSLLLPWAVRNAHTIQRYNEQTAPLEPLPRAALVTSYGPLNFALANGSRADGGFRPEALQELTGARGLNLGEPRVRELYIRGYAEGLRWLAGNPRAGARLMLSKVDRWLDGLRLGVGVSNLPGGLKGARPPVDLFRPEGEGLKWGLAALLAAGVALSFRAERRGWLLCTLVLAHRAMMTLLFFGYTRGLVVMLPVVVPLLLLPLMEVAGESRSWVPLALAGVVALAVVPEAVHRAAGPPRRFMADDLADGAGGAPPRMFPDDWVRVWPGPEGN